MQFLQIYIMMSSMTETDGYVVSLDRASVVFGRDASEGVGSPPCLPPRASCRCLLGMVPASPGCVSPDHARRMPHARRPVKAKVWDVCDTVSLWKWKAPGRCRGLGGWEGRLDYYISLSVS